ncbi:hypothetical protein T492DRAFT_1089783, partial [Pavlovales sp. CCMP2436]
MANPPAWHFRQIFGERDPSEETAEEDLISAVEFNEDGTYLATGDRGGRIVIFESSEMDGVPKGNGQTKCLPRYANDASDEKRSAASKVEYRFYCEFQSHEPEFDYLKSLEIEERINGIRWCRGYAGSRCLLSTNDKTIKLWKVYEKTVKLVSDVSHEPGPQGSNAAIAGIAPKSGLTNTDGGTLYPTAATVLRLPRITPHDVIVTAMPKRVYANGHAYHINSIGVNCDGESFLSADDLRVNLWHLGASDTCFNLVDIKPNDMEDLSEVGDWFVPPACAHLRAGRVVAHLPRGGQTRHARRHSAALSEAGAHACARGTDRTSVQDLVSLAPPAPRPARSGRHQFALHLRGQL